ncbi:MAG: TerB family tellurite resistance protein [Steroidobacteraceae bacterium]
MLRTLNELLARLASQPASPADDEHALQLATAVLLVEVSRADSRFGDDERAAIRQSLDEKFDLAADERERLLELATRESIAAHDLYQFTAVINSRFDEPHKLRMIRALWRIAFADGQLSAHEEHLMRRVADLLHVPHATNMLAKLREAEAAKS